MIADVPRADGIKLKAGPKSGKYEGTNTSKGKNAKGDRGSKDDTGKVPKSKGQSAPEPLSKKDESAKYFQPAKRSVVPGGARSFIASAPAATAEVANRQGCGTSDGTIGCPFPDQH